jgi:hypothetical protein
MCQRRFNAYAKVTRRKANEALNYFVTKLKKMIKHNLKEIPKYDKFIVLDDFFERIFLKYVLGEFPDLSMPIYQPFVKAYNKGSNERLKYASKGEAILGSYTRQLIYELHTARFLEFLQELTGIKETLLPDPYLIGGGLHETKRGGCLGLHVDFNKHPLTQLDRRLNLIVYLNEALGGDFQLNQEIISTAFNRVVIFNTTENSFHGHPTLLRCDSRKSIALYYYTNGGGMAKKHSTIFHHSKKWFHL